MNNIRLILKVYFMGRFGINKALHSRDPKQRQKALMTAVFSMIGVLAVVAYWTLYCVIIDENMRAAGFNTGLIAIVFAIVNVICLGMTVYQGTSILFSSEDFNIVMPLPIKMSEMVTAKIITLYVSNLFLTLGFMLPAMGIYVWHQSPGFLFYLYGIIALVATPMVPIIIGVVLSVIISMISTRFKYKNFISIVLMVIVFGGIMSFSFGMMGMGEKSLNVMGDNLLKNIGPMINKIYPMTPLFVSALCDYSFLDVLGLVSISLGSFGLFVAIIGPRFGAIHTMLNTSKTTKDYRMSKLETTSPLIAMYKRELRRFISSPMYVMNASFGSIMLVIMSAALIFKQKDFVEVIGHIPELAEIVPFIVCMTLAIAIVTTDTTAISLSMEGKYFGLLRSYPISVMDIFLAKIMVNLTVTLPVVVIVVPIMGIVCQMSALEILGSYLFSAMYALLGAMFGMIVNLVFPKLEWDHETVVIKHSIASLLGVLGGIPLVLLSGVGILFVGVLDMSLIILLLSMMIGILNAILYSVLKTWGVRRFYEL